MKIYEKPLVDIKTFDVEDVMAASGTFDANDTSGFDDIIGSQGNDYTGVIFEW